ncbi:hypothetical protein G9A89_010867 [Geosiphon pyriformis]|nr:hypothetical protein G9A89_010867 [Geosiphon pyriformis]
MSTSVDNSIISKISSNSITPSRAAFQYLSSFDVATSCYRFSLAFLACSDTYVNLSPQFRSLFVLRKEKEQWHIGYIAACTFRMLDIHQILKDVKLQLHELKDVHETISKLAAKANANPLSVEFAQHLDESDDLKNLRSEFSIPKVGDIVPKEIDPIAPNEDSVYLCGNSLGLFPKRTRQLIKEELDVWASSGVTGHFEHKYNRPWSTIDETVTGKTAELIGAKPIEVAVMNTLTSNLHLLMVSFYTPTKDRYKILIEEKAFPSDQYAIESQLRFHGHQPSDALITVKSHSGAHTLENQDIIDLINKEGDKIAVVLLSAVQYYTGQFFHIEKITKAAHKKGCIVALDLAHAVGNVVLRLHDWKVDFAVWCSYKYLNAGPGAIGGIFIHEKHARDFNRPSLHLHRFAGWWGHDKNSRFQMNKPFQPLDGAGGFQVSNPSVLDTVALLGSLEVFSQTNMWDLRTKSILLTGYLDYLLEKEIHGKGYKIITPKDPRQRGAQLSILIEGGKLNKVLEKLFTHGIVVDERRPDCLRVSPAPLYNTFSDVWRFVKAFKFILSEI